ncbi:MAG: hypothetical protein ISS94_03700 [Candidatus Syntrophoarchaeum sp.]|nr:hypothetical protein [Candidatus Syntrophoarchaeum sp.]
MKEQDFVHLPGVLAVAEGYNGQVALFDSAHPSVDQVIERVRWIWRLVTLYWANLSVLGEFLSKRIIMTFSLGEKEQLEFLRVYFSESVNLLTTELQSKINRILFILNILTFSTVIATLIIIYDIKNEIFLPNWRLLLVIMGTGLFGLLSLMFLVKGRLFKSLKGKQRGY